MTSRERVRKVLNHQIPDRIPNGLGGCETAGLHVLTYDKLQNLLDVKKTPPRIDSFESNAVFELDMIKAMEGDILLLASPKLCNSELWIPGYESQWRELSLWGKTIKVPAKDTFIFNEDGSVIWKKAWRNGSDVTCPVGAYFFDWTPDTVDFDDFDYPKPEDINPSHDRPDEELRILEETARHMYNTTDLSLSLGECLPDMQWLPGGMLNGMMFLAECPETFGEILDKFVDAALDQLKLIHQAVGSYVDIVNIAHDIGDNRGILVGAPLFRRVYKPLYKKFFQGWKKITGMRICLHTCGAVIEVLDDLIECGLDIYNPVQISGRGMNPVELKRRFGDTLIFWGGAYDAHQNNPQESYNTVYERALENIQALGEDGGYIMSGVHNLLPEVPEHHLKAILDAWKDSRYY
jgi:uroporphyrinogen decarboxylase